VGFGWARSSPSMKNAILRGTLSERSEADCPAMPYESPRTARVCATFSGAGNGGRVERYPRPTSGEVHRGARIVPLIVALLWVQRQPTNVISKRRTPVDTANPAYGFKRTISAPVEEADRRVREALKKEGFGILTEIDVRATMKQKLDVDFKPYLILGACNPPLAHRALSAEEDIGLLLPCNVVVYEGEAAGTSVVAVINPSVQLAITGRDDIGPLAEEVGTRMRRALDAV
jgi:uncharacterized protein (DUF302 family)